jgi:hypothetical protein
VTKIQTSQFKPKPQKFDKSPRSGVPWGKSMFKGDFTSRNDAGVKEGFSQAIQKMEVSQDYLDFKQTLKKVL